MCDDTYDVWSAQVRTVRGVGCGSVKLSIPRFEAEEIARDCMNQSILAICPQATSLALFQIKPQLHGRTYSLYAFLFYPIVIIMAEAVGIAASVNTVIDLSAKFASRCSEYYANVKNARDDIERLQSEAQGLEATL